jgi:hypothetical protein
VTVDFDEDRAVDIELRPGEASLHDISVIHGSSANGSALPRTGFIVRYASREIRQPANPVYCLRGNPGIGSAQIAGRNGFRRGLGCLHRVCSGRSGGAGVSGAEVRREACYSMLSRFSPSRRTSAS